MKSASGDNKNLRDAINAVLKNRRPSNIGFRMMPMIDMLFLLLIFFLLTLQFHPVESYLPFKLPGVSEGSQFGRAEPLILSLKHRSSGCTIQIGSTKTISVNAKTMDSDLFNVAQQIRTVIVEQKRTAADPVEFVCDSGTEWQYIAKLYNILFSMGIKDITFRMTE